MVCRHCMVSAEIVLLTPVIFLGLMYGLLPPYNYVRFSPYFLESSRACSVQCFKRQCFATTTRRALEQHQVSVQREE